MDRVGREEKPEWPKEARKCPMCQQGEVEDVAHFIAECPAYTKHRARLNTQVTLALQDNDGLADMDYGQMDARAQTRGYGTQTLQTGSTGILRDT